MMENPIVAVVKAFMDPSRPPMPASPAPAARTAPAATATSPAPKLPAGGALFHPHENELPRVARQPHADLDKLYEHAHEADNQMRDILDRGKGLADKLGFKTHLPETNAGPEPDVSGEGGHLAIGPIKKRARVQEKAAADYGGDHGRVLDMVRASFAVDHHHEIPHIIQHMRDSGLELARKPADRFANPTPAGYRDALTHWKLPNGHVAEVQFHVKPILQAKAAGHHLYEQARSVEAKASSEGRDLTAEESAHVGHLNDRMRKEFYDPAWKRATGEVRKAIMHNLPDHGKHVVYFDWEGLPAYQVGKHGFIYTLRGGTWRRTNEMTRFYHQAHEVPKHDFDSLVRAHLGHGTHVRKAVDSLLEDYRGVDPGVLIPDGRYVLHLAEDEALEGYVHEGAFHCVDHVAKGVSALEEQGARPELRPLPVSEVLRRIPGAIFQPVGE